MSTRPLFALTLFAATAALVGCARKPVEPVKTPPPIVIVDNPVARKVNDYEDFAGRTEPFKVVELKSRVTGHLKKIHFKDGQDIEAGKPLFDIDDSTYVAALGQAKAALTKAEATRDKAEAARDKAEATLTKAETHLKTTTNTYNLVKQSYDSGTETRDVYDKASGDKDEAAAEVKAAKAEIRAATAEMRAAKFEIDAQTSAVALADTNLKFCRIVAPFDGRLSKRLVDEENLVKADDTSLTNIVRLDQVYATFDVDERTALRVRGLIFKGEAKSARTEARTVQIALADEDDFGSRTGQIVFSDNQFDAGTGTQRVRAVMPNPKQDAEPKYLLSPGQFVRVRLPIGPPRDAVLVPEKAIGSDQGQRFVYVVKAEKVENASPPADVRHVVVRRDVKVGQQYGQMRVIESNVVSPADRVIVEGLLRVRPGAEVNPKPAPAPKDSAPKGAAPPTGPIAAAPKEK